jgi:DNA-binding GntR family transcriptional regulator
MLATRLRSILSVTPKTPQQWAEAVEDHKEMMAALDAKDCVRFAATARRYTRHQADMMRTALDTLEARVDAKHPRND